MYVLSDKIIIANALYAKETDSLKHEEIEEYKKLLYQMITKQHKYIMFRTSESNILKVEDHVFIKTTEGVSCMEPIDEEFIEELNSIYPEDIRKTIRLSHDKSKEKVKQKSKTEIKK